MDFWGRKQKVSPGEEKGALYELSSHTKENRRDEANFGSLFNMYFMKQPFHIWTISCVLECMRPSDWITIIKLRDTYFHISYYFKALKIAVLPLPKSKKQSASFLLFSGIFYKCKDTATTQKKDQGFGLLRQPTTQWKLYSILPLLIKPSAPYPVINLPLPPSH